LVSGYKQAINPQTTKGMWTPFLIMGPGVKKGAMLEAPISHVDQLPTILKILNVEIPPHVQGRVLTEIVD
jgi:arylsulfatase A-like enzyme